ncbi:MULTISPECIES: hypothetical protein [Pseudomonas]|jgi:hypothetical protein|uniref:hypothetical protein n=1 Tax=Pseudomonas TaxID=286 RepID=UPI003B976B8C
MMHNTERLGIGTIFTQALEIRVAYAKAVIFEDECTQFEHEIEAHILGADAHRAGLPNVPGLFKTVPALNRAWDEGVNAAINGGGWSRFTEEEEDMQLQTPEPGTASDLAYGKLAFDECGIKYPLQILKSAAGYYIGTYDEFEPVSRESSEYYRTRAAAEQAMTLNTWTQRLDQGSYWS